MKGKMKTGLFKAGLKTSSITQSQAFLSQDVTQMTSEWETLCVCYAYTCINVHVLLVGHTHSLSFTMTSLLEMSGLCEIVCVFTSTN